MKDQFYHIIKFFSIVILIGFIAQRINAQNFHQISKVVANDGDTDDRFGYSVSISGNKAIIGASHDNDKGENSGSAYVFRYEKGKWIQEEKLTATDGDEYDYFGRAVDISGNKVIIGAYVDDDKGFGSGSVYIYKFDGNNWVQEAKLTASDADVTDAFGTSVSISGDKAMIGAFWDNDKGHHSGSAYIFHFDGENWVEEAKIVAKDGSEHDGFGRKVSISGNRGIVGTSDDDSETGSVYVFGNNGNGWVQEAKLMASDKAIGDCFGVSISLFENKIAVGAYKNSNKGKNSGSVYIFQNDGNGWNEQIKLTASDGTIGDFFGRSVSLFKNKIVVGAYHDDNKKKDSGSVYIFNYDGSSWNEQTKLTVEDGDVEDWFGVSVNIFEDKLVVGMMFDDDKGKNSGSVYFFDLLAEGQPKTIEVIDNRGTGMSEGDDMKNGME